MSITYYSFPRDKDKVLSKHFKMGEFVSSSDYTSGNYPSSVPIHDKLPEILEKVYDHFGATCGIICSGYRTPACDREVGGSGSDQFLSREYISRGIATSKIDHYI